MTEEYLGLLRAPTIGLAVLQITLETLFCEISFLLQHQIVFVRTMQLSYLNTCWSASTLNNGLLFSHQYPSLK